MSASRHACGQEQYSPGWFRAQQPNGGHNFTSSKKYRDALRYGRVAIVVDVVLPPWRPRFVEVRGTVEAFEEGGKEINAGFVPGILRITPTYIVSIGISEGVVMPGQGKVNYYGRKVT